MTVCFSDPQRIRTCQYFILQSSTVPFSASQSCIQQMIRSSSGKPMQLNFTIATHPF